VVERDLDLVLGLVELVEGAVPGIELTRMDANPPVLVPVGDESSPVAVADEVGLEPAGEAVLAGRRGAMSRLATSTKARSAKGTALARPRYWSRIPQRPN
jgi:hypothetical protein